MRLEELDFDFPEELIAQHPAEPRDSCRLLHLQPSGRLDHRVFSELPDILLPGDMLVFNDSRVLPARLHAHKTTGGEVEVLFLRPLEVGGDTALQAGRSPAEVWEALARPSHRLRPEQQLILDGGEEITLRSSLGEGRWMVVGPPGRSLVTIMEAHGKMPLPPYIRTYPDRPDSYQTVYAAVPGSAAAPTAGLHFTLPLLERLQEEGVDSVRVTLHVGLDTFLPIREEVVEDHRIHRETYSVQAGALARIVETKRAGRRLVAVGTTVARVLETLARTGALEGSATQSTVGGSTDIYITPGHHFQAVDALLTNFHLPRSTVLVLTTAFAGAKRLRCAYQEAIRLRYRFFSFGDAMLIERPDQSAATGPAPDGAAVRGTVPEES
ncbi:MAG: tRNA preQ1(34) S-adenosylmethionine ribosyltransferase-isomerase QueA [Actinobacteria bacterium]|nr:tRNA preQ1(34) S-adenosylmethionine ribosyltransferase-isomerase QueA [Actinomycetota bacterium]